MPSHPYTPSHLCSYKDSPIQEMMFIIAHNQHIISDPSSYIKDRGGAQQMPSIGTQPSVNGHVQGHESEDQNW